MFIRTEIEFTGADHDTSAVDAESGDEHSEGNSGESDEDGVDDETC